MGAQVERYVDGFEDPGITETDRASEPDEPAICVEAVSKYYTLWSSPSARLTYSLLRLGRRVLPLPSSMAARFDAHAADLHRRFPALHDVSLQIRKGESWGVIGVNGSGKSTLLKMISGNLQPSGGRIEVAGKVAILDYSSGLNGEFTGRENVYIKAAIHGMSRAQVDERFDSIAAFAEIGEFIDQPVKTYSSGMVGRLGFAIMAHVDADIIITDEALAVGDAFFVQKCMAFIRDFLKNGTFLFVSHSINDVVSLCEKALWLEHGRIREIGLAKDIAKSYLSQNMIRLSEVYVAKETAADHVSTKLSRNASGGADVDDAPGGAGNVARLDQPTLARARNHHPPRRIRDPRLELINRTQWRNDIVIPQFETSGPGFGIGGAKIEEVVFEDQEGAVLSSIIGGEMVLLRVRVRATRDLTSPIVGFQVVDRLGQILFGDNTYVTTVQRPICIDSGERFSANFCFQMPLLPVGEYAIRAAVARGSDSEAAMMHVIDTALVFRSTASGARYGLIGIPMHLIELSREVDDASRGS